MSHIDSSVGRLFLPAFALVEQGKATTQLGEFLAELPDVAGRGPGDEPINDPLVLEDEALAAHQHVLNAALKDDPFPEVEGYEGLRYGAIMRLRCAIR